MSENPSKPTPLAERLPRVASPATPAWLGPRVVAPPARPLFTAPAPGDAGAAAATAEAESHKRALKQARDEAERAGLATAQAKIEEIVERYLKGIQRLLTATRLAHRPEPGEVVALALLIAKELLGRELGIDRDQLLAVIDQALGSVSADTQLVLRVSPADAAYVRQRRPELLRAGVVLVEDKTLAVGGCIVETPAWVLDASIEARLEAVRAGLVDLLAAEPPADAAVDDVDDVAEVDESATIEAIAEEDTP